MLHEPQCSSAHPGRAAAEHRLAKRRAVAGIEQAEVECAVNANVIF